MANHYDFFSLCVILKNDFMKIRIPIFVLYPEIMLKTRQRIMIALRR